MIVTKKYTFSTLNAHFIESLRGKLECVRNKLPFQEFRAREPFQNWLMACIFGDILSVDVTRRKAMLKGDGVNKHLAVINKLFSS